MVGLFFCFALYGGTVEAHGVVAAVAEEEAVAVRFGYAGGEPMGYAEVLVYAPDGKTGAAEFQNGRTDAQGRFAFIPNVAGTWRVVASDMGHRGELLVAVDNASLVTTSASSEQGPTVLKAVLGMSLIGNMLAGCLFYRRKKQAIISSSSESVDE